MIHQRRRSVKAFAAGRGKFGALTEVFRSGEGKFVRCGKRDGRGRGTQTGDGGRPQGRSEAEGAPTRRRGAEPHQGPVCGAIRGSLPTRRLRQGWDGEPLPSSVSRGIGGPSTSPGGGGKTGRGIRFAGTSSTASGPPSPCAGKARDGRGRGTRALREAPLR